MQQILWGQTEAGLSFSGERHQITDIDSFYLLIFLLL